MSTLRPHSKPIVFSIVVGLACWLIIMFVLLSWFQSNYVHSFTFNNPKFLHASYTEKWFKSLLLQLPDKKTAARVIQFWQPDCLCNRFARPHSLKTLALSKALGYEHITVIPSSYKSQSIKLKSLNPDTQIVFAAQDQLDAWPAAPSVLIEGKAEELLYFGPFGYGSFCNQASTSVIETQLSGVESQFSRPFYNQIGQGCFCNWEN